MNRILFTSLSSGLIAAMTIGLTAPAQANPDYSSNYCTESIQEEIYTLQSSDNVRITDVQPQVTRTCYASSPSKRIYYSNFNHSNFGHSNFGHSNFGHSNFYRSNFHRSNFYRSNFYRSRSHRDDYRSIVPPQIQIRLGGPDFSITNGWRREHRDHWDNRGYHREHFNRDHRYSHPIGFPIFKIYRHR
jgi:Pentapeptide repeats (8 copies)